MKLSCKVFIGEPERTDNRDLPKILEQLERLEFYLLANRIGSCLGMWPKTCSLCYTHLVGTGQRAGLGGGRMCLYPSMCPKSSRPPSSSKKDQTQATPNCFSLRHLQRLIFNTFLTLAPPPAASTAVGVYTEGAGKSQDPLLLSKL